jgi:hypothetical protein
MHVRVHIIFKKHHDGVVNVPGTGDRRVRVYVVVAENAYLLPTVLFGKPFFY